MANITQSLAYAPEVEWDSAAVVPETKIEKKSAKIRRRKPTPLTAEDIEIVAALEAVKSDMDFIHNCFDQITEAILIDSLIYELKALNLKYQYYTNLCKEKGIVCAGVPELRE